MINILFSFITLLACPAPKIVNKTTTWTDRDQRTLVYAKKRCATIYSDAPCLKLFTKTKELAYQAICGEKE